MESGSNDELNRLNLLLAPGLSFCPTDEDLMLHFVYHLSPNSIIPHLDQLHLFNPWQLHGKALSNGEVHYFFSRVEEISIETESGYWKDVLMDEPIYNTATGDQLGIKKFHVFSFGQLGHHHSPTTWVMQQYRIYNTQSQDKNNDLSQTKSEFGLWSLCRVFETKDNTRSIFSYADDEDNDSELSYLDEMYLTFDDI